MYISETKKILNFTFISYSGHSRLRRPLPADIMPGLRVVPPIDAELGASARPFSQVRYHFRGVISIPLEDAVIFVF